jgi:hypothetical protein
MSTYKGGASAREVCLKVTEELRKERVTGALPDDSGHVAFFIPEEDFWRHAIGEVVHVDRILQTMHVRRGKYPGLISPDRDEARREIMRLLRDYPEYKINPHEGRRGMPLRGVVVK